ncbi:MAG: 50S ribosomal protein L34 [Candidatus Pacebacteria bacterium]|nr:50S ribosomal protein L34 [Candidatus Paceibacterota bacterium]
MPKRTNQPSKLKRVRSHGFRARLKKAAHILKQRRDKKRQSLAVTVKSKRYK